MKSYTYRIIIEPDGKQFHGYVPALQGCHTFGNSLEETRKHLRDAIAVYLESLQSLGDAIPEDKSMEAFETVNAPVSGLHA